MTEGTGDIGPAGAAARLLDRIDDLDLAGSGSFLHADGTTLPW